MIKKVPTTQPVNQPNLIFWAVIEHHRWWFADDGVHLQSIAQNGLNGQNLRNIAKSYFVSRGIYGGRESELAEHINNQSTEWPENLLERCQFCANLATYAEEEGWTRGQQASAMSKLMWFLKPTKWTMFDQFAANGAEVPRNANPLLRMQNFFTAIHNRGFTHAAGEIQAVIDEREQICLFGERVIDKFLMLRGFDENRRTTTINYCQYYLNILPEAQKNSLIDLAGAIQASCADGLLRLPANI